MRESEPQLPPVHAPDTREGLSHALVTAIAERLARREQSLVFVNRRGFAPSLLCGSCGWRAECPNCSARLVVHREARGLRGEGGAQFHGGRYSGKSFHAEGAERRRTA